MGRRREVSGVRGDGFSQDEQLLQRLVDQLPGMVAYWDCDLRLVLVNAAYCAFVDRSAERLRGEHFATVLGDEVYRANLPHLRAALAGERQVFERTLADGSGSVRHTEVSYSPDVVDGQVVGVFALIADITDRVRVQLALDEAQAIAGVASWTYDLGDGTLSWSRHLFRLAGQDPDHDVADWATYAALVHPEDRVTIEAIRDHATAGRPHEARYRLVVDGEIRHVHTQSRPVLNEDDHVVLVRGTVQDETAATLQAQRLLEEKRRFADLIAMVGHDVRQPLAIVLAYLEETIQEWEDGDVERRQSNIARAFVAA